MARGDSARPCAGCSAAEACGRAHAHHWRGDGRVLASACALENKYELTLGKRAFAPVKHIYYKHFLTSSWTRRNPSPLGIQLPYQLRVLGVGDGPLGHLLRSLEVVQLAHAR